jgi:hypothetical protein
VYLAGIWASTLAEDLAWKIDELCTSRPKLWRAPTWSWASVDGRIKIPTIKKKDCHAKVIDVLCEPASTDSTGIVSETAYAILEGPVIRSLRSAQRIPLCSYNNLANLSHIFRIYPDFQWLQGDNSLPPEQDICCLAIGCLDNGRYEIKYFLILRSESSERKVSNVYTRIGLLELHMDLRQPGIGTRPAASNSGQSEKHDDADLMLGELSQIEEIRAAIRDSPLEVLTVL